MEKILYHYLHKGVLFDGTQYCIPELSMFNKPKKWDTDDEVILWRTSKIKNLESEQTQLAIQELEKVNQILTDTIIEVTQDEFDLNKLYYLEEISAKFCNKIQAKIKELKE